MCKKFLLQGFVSICFARTTLQAHVASHEIHQWYDFNFYPYVTQANLAPHAWMTPIFISSLLASHAYIYIYINAQSGAPWDASSLVASDPSSQLIFAFPMPTWCCQIIWCSWIVSPTWSKYSDIPHSLQPWEIHLVHQKDVKAWPLLQWWIWPSTWLILRILIGGPSTLFGEDQATTTPAMPSLQQTMGRQLLPAGAP